MRVPFGDFSSPGTIILRHIHAHGLHGRFLLGALGRLFGARNNNPQPQGGVAPPRGAAAAAAGGAVGNNANAGGAAAAAAQLPAAQVRQR